MTTVDYFEVIFGISKKLPMMIILFQHSYLSADEKLSCKAASL